MTNMEPKLFVSAIYDWPEFLATVRIWWKLVGDPRGYTQTKMKKCLREPALLGTRESQDWLKTIASKRLWQRLTDRYPLHPFWPGFLKLKIADISEGALKQAS
jgi:hypothetical protein